MIFRFLKRKDIGKAPTPASEAAPKKDDSWEELFSEGIKFYKQGIDGDKEAVHEAYRLFESVLKIVPDNNLVKAHFGSTVSLLGRDAVDPNERFEKTIKGLKIMDEAVESEPENTEIRIQRAFVCYRLPETYFHRTSTAICDFEYLISKYEKDPNTFSSEFYAQLLYNLGDAYKTLERKDEAFTVWKKLMQITDGKKYQNLLRQEGLQIPDCSPQSVTPKSGTPALAEEDGGDCEDCEDCGDITGGIDLHQRALSGEQEAARDGLAFFSRKMEEYPGDPLLMAYTADCMSLVARDAPEPTDMFAGAIKGMKLFDKAVNAAPQRIEIRLLRAEQSLRLPEGFFCRTATAITDFEYLLNRYEEDDSVFSVQTYHMLLYKLGTAYDRLGMNQEKDKIWEKLLSLEPETEYKKLVREETEDNLTFTPPEELTPENRNPFYAEGKRLHDLAVAGKKQATPFALELWLKAFEADSLDPVAEAYYGSCLALTGRDATDTKNIFINTIKGLKHLNRAIGRDWKNPELRLLRGYLCYSLPETFFHLTEKAVKDLRFIKMAYETNTADNAVISKEQYHQVLYDLGMAYERLGDPSAARKVWRKLLKVNPGPKYADLRKKISFGQHYEKEEE